MSLTNALVILALGASLLLLFQHKRRLFPLIAAIASGIEALLTFHLIRLSVRSLNLWLILGAALLIAGAIIWTRAAGKLHVSAATVVTLVGALQIFGALV